MYYESEVLRHYECVHCGKKEVLPKNPVYFEGRPVGGMKIHRDAWSKGDFYIAICDDCRNKIGSIILDRRLAAHSRPCPFCSGYNLTVWANTSTQPQGSITTYVRCGDCQAEGPKVKHDVLPDQGIHIAVYTEESFKAWNSLEDNT